MLLRSVDIIISKSARRHRPLIGKFEGHGRFVAQALIDL